MICGNHEFINRARKLRKLLGGGMRQAGIIAAAGIVALKEMINRLSQDHEHAKILAEGLANLDGILINPNRIKTNIVFFDLDPAKIKSTEVFLRQLEEKGIKLIQLGLNKVRAVTHYMVGKNDIDKTLSVISAIL